MLRSVPKKFNYKVIAIEEVQDITTMKLDELIGSLRAFEMRLKIDERDTKKEIAFTPGASKTVPAIAVHKEILESMALMTKTFNRAFKKSIGKLIQKEVITKIRMIENQKVLPRETKGFNVMSV